MARTASISAQIARNAGEALRVLIVLSSAIALIAAERALPF